MLLTDILKVLIRIPNKYYLVFLYFTEILQANYGKIFHPKSNHVCTHGEYRHSSSLSLTSVPDVDG